MRERSQHDGCNRNQTRRSSLNRYLAFFAVAGFITSAAYAWTKATAAPQPPKKNASSAKADDDKQPEPSDGKQPKGDEKEPADKPEPKIPEYPVNQRVKVPAGILEGGAGWLNVSGDINFKDLRGKIVVLDFWTYCCINCMHVLPDLDFLEKKYAKELVVIGVHSAKFENEKDTENIRNAIMKYEIRHPVVNDSKMLIWRKFGVRSWPSIVVVDAEGNACFITSGEGKREVLDFLIGKLVAYHKAKGTLDETPFRFDLEVKKAKPTPLRYPGKILADEKNNRLFISDSNHNRIVVSTLDGKLQYIVGSGALGAKDGSFSEASFDHPQGMELVGETLYVADTENHLIRSIDLKTKTVSTLAGTGEKAQTREFAGKLRKTALNSPWALSHVNGVLHVAMAGPHQMWAHQLGSDTIEVYAGSGREDIIDGPLQDAAMAQPSGIATDGKFLYVCDSEGSSIRAIPVDPKAEMTTIIGSHDLPLGRCLFEFGDTDGIGDEARLQHPLGITFHNGDLYVADTYNHKIKKLTFTSGKKPTWKSTTWLGTGKAGKSLDPPQFAEPSGVTIAGGKLYIADTNNHRICTADLKTGQVAELVIAGLQPPKPPKQEEGDIAATKEIEQVKLQTVAAGETLNFEVKLSLPEGFKLNTLAPVLYRLKADGQQTLIAASQLNARKKATGKETTINISVPLDKTAGKGSFELAVSFGYCRDGVGGLCKIKTARWRIPVKVTEKAKQKTITLTAKAK